MKKICLVSIFLLCIGCASYYKVPTNGQTALLELDSNVSPVIVQHFENEQCETGSNGTRLSYLHPTHGDQPSGTTKTITANRQFIITFKKVEFGSGWECTYTGTFSPQTGATYKAMYRLEDEKCYLNILRKEVHGQSIKYFPEPSFRPSEKICFNSITG